MIRSLRGPAATLLALAALSVAPGVHAQTKDPGFAIEQVMSMPFPYGLVGAKGADRVAWMEDEKGRRNVYTAAAPGWERVKLTAWVDDDGVDLQSVQISDDGTTVAFVRGHTLNFKGQLGNQGTDPEGGKREIWAASTAGKRPAWRVVGLDLEPSGGGARGGGRGAAFQLSPDGKWVLYVKDGQIHRASVDPGTNDRAVADEAPPFFVVLGQSSAPVWSPDGRKVAFVTARFDQRQYFPTQGAVPTHSFVAVYDLDSRKVTYLAPSVDMDGSPAWSPDGKSVAFVRRPGLPFGHFATAPLKTIERAAVPQGFLEAKLEGGYRAAILVADATTGVAREVWHDAVGDTQFAQPQGLTWADGHFVFGAEDDTWPRMYSVPVSGAAPAVAPTMLTPGQGLVERYTVSSDGKWLYYSSNAGDQDRRHLWRVAVAGGKAEQITTGALIETTVTAPGSGEALVALQSGPAQPISIAVFAPTGGTGKVIGPPMPADFPAAKHVIPTAVEITAADGMVSHAIVFEPAGSKPGEKHPALVYLHGNGGRLVLGYPDQSDGYYQDNYGLIQYFVSKGYVVAAMNYRADGPLYTPEYNTKKNYGAEGVSEYGDALAAGVYLKGRPDVDVERIGVYGLSYGGWLTGEALSRNSDLFKAGAIFAGVQMRSTSFDPTNLAYQSSPAFNIDKWTSPTLFIHGDDDRNVEFSQAIGLVMGLRARGVPHKAFVMPDETHYMLVFATRAKAFHELDQWMDRMLIRKEGVQKTAATEN